MTRPTMTAFVVISVTNAPLTYSAAGSAVSRQRTHDRIAIAAPTRVAATLIAMSSSGATQTVVSDGASQRTMLATSRTPPIAAIATSSRRGRRIGTGTATSITVAMVAGRGASAGVDAENPGPADREPRFGVGGRSAVDQR